MAARPSVISRPCSSCGQKDCYDLNERSQKARRSDRSHVVVQLDGLLIPLFIKSLFIDVLEDDIDLFDQLFFSQRCTDAGTGIVRADVKFFFHRRQIAVVLRILDTGRHGGRDRIHTAVLQQGDSVIDGRDALQLRIRLI